MDYTTAPGYALLNGVRQFVDRNLPAITGTSLVAADKNAVMNEIVNCILQSGLTPSASDLTQLWAAIQAAVSAGTKNAVLQQIDKQTLGITHFGYNAGSALIGAQDSAGNWHYLAERSTAVLQQIDDQTLGVTHLGYGQQSGLVGAQDSAGNWHYLAERSTTVLQQIDDQTLGITHLGYGQQSGLVSAQDSAGNWHYLAERAWVQAQIGQDITTFSAIATSQSVTVPSWATRLEAKVIAGGGGGGNCQTTTDTGNKSAAGGGSGEYRHGVYACVTGQNIAFVVGTGGGSQSSGTLSSVTIGSNTVIQSAPGVGATFGSTGISAGGGGGITGFGGNITSVFGSSGSDGQNGSMYFAGNGGNGIFGGAGRAGAKGGQDGSAFGAGGGGAYDPTNSGTIYYGGNGAPGLILFRFLP